MYPHMVVLDGLTYLQASRELEDAADNSHTVPAPQRSVPASLLHFADIYLESFEGSLLWDHVLVEADLVHRSHIRAVGYMLDNLDMLAVAVGIQ
jgi:hypothetical protein